MIRAVHVLVLVLLSSPFVTPALTAQGSSLAGIDGERLVAGRDSLEIFAVRGRDTVRTGMVWDELSLTQENDGAALLRVYRSHDRVLGMRLDSITDEQASLRPIRHRSRTDRAWETLEFAGDAVTFWVEETTRKLCQQVMQLEPGTQILFRRIAPQTRRLPTITALQMTSLPLLPTRVEIHFEG